MERTPIQLLAYLGGGQYAPFMTLECVEIKSYLEWKFFSERFSLSRLPPQNGHFLLKVYYNRYNDAVPRVGFFITRDPVICNPRNSDHVVVCGIYIDLIDNKWTDDV
jgi:hypothetical protein